MIKIGPSRPTCLLKNPWFLEFPFLDGIGSFREITIFVQNKLVIICHINISVEPLKTTIFIPRNPFVFSDLKKSKISTKMWKRPILKFPFEFLRNIASDTFDIIDGRLKESNSVEVIV